MRPPENASDAVEPPNIFRQIGIFYLLTVLALFFSFVVAGAIASGLELSHFGVWFFIAPLFVAVVLFFQVDTLVERRIKAYHATMERDQSGGHAGSPTED